MAKKILGAGFFAMILCVGTVSALQLKKDRNILFCRGVCSATVHCSGPCFCWIPDGATTGGCVKDPPGLKLPK